MENRKRNRLLLLYLHIPKTAGTSMTDAIYDEYNDATGSYEEEGKFCEGIYYYPSKFDFFRTRKMNVQPKTLRAIHRVDLRVVTGHFSFGLHTLIDRPASYATMLRHPVDRIASLYYHLKRWPSYEEHEWKGLVGWKPLGAKTSLNDFIRNYSLLELDNDQTRRVAGQNPAFGECTRLLLNTAKSNIEHYFSFVGVTERFDESLQVASKMLRWRAKPGFYESMKNECRVPTALITSKTREAILERNMLDLELYLFANDWLNHRLPSNSPR